MHALKNFIHLLMTPLAMASCSQRWAILRGFRLRRTACATLMLALGVGYLGSTSLVGDALLGPLERRYPPLELDAARACRPMWSCSARDMRRATTAGDGRPQ